MGLEVTVIGTLRVSALIGVMMIAAVATVPAWAARLVLDSPRESCFSLSIPSGWLVASSPQHEADDDPELPRIVSLFPDPKAQVWLGLWHARLVNSLEEAKQRFDDLDDFILQDTKVTEARDRTLAGFPAHQVLGTAVSDGEPVNFGVVSFEYAPGAIGVGIYIGEEGEWNAYGNTVVEALETIRVEQAACGEK